MTAGIQAVTFDAGGTLIEPWPSVGHIYAEIAARHGVERIQPDLLNNRFVAAWHGRKDFDYTRDEWAAVVDETFAGLCAELPSRTFFPELYEYFAQPAAWRIFEDVRPSLAALAARGMRLGVISNWDERLRPLLGRLGLADLFEVVTVSCEAGFAKPDKKNFEAAAGEFKLPSNQILHVGDSFREDVEGATQAGFKATLLLRHTASTTCEYIRSLAEIDL